jgi:uncharacterized protein YndB with AHSA1/START domain
MPSSIRISQEYPYPIDHIWFALTDANALGTWLMPNTFQEKMHHKFQFRTPPQTGFDGIVECEVIGLVAPTFLAYTWKGGPMKRPTTVRWHLEAIGEQRTKLTLEHTGFVVKAILGFGWKKLLLQKLQKHLDKTP